MPLAGKTLESTGYSVLHLYSTPTSVNTLFPCRPSVFIFLVFTTAYVELAGNFHPGRDIHCHIHTYIYIYTIISLARYYFIIIAP